jgi:uncharacterized protein
VSTPILAEYELLLRRPRFASDPKRVDRSLARMLVQPGRTLSVSPDESDNRFLECAEASKANYLITGNKRHFPGHWKIIAIVNAREFAELIGPDLKPLIGTN